jgi:hypothetical protein
MLQTIIVDNFFDNVEDIINLSKELDYHTASENENWPGLRTDSLHSTHYDLFNSVIIKILNYYYPNKKINYSNSKVVFSKLKHDDQGK